MNLKEYVNKSKNDPNLFWKLQAGEIENLLDEAIEELQKCKMSNASLADLEEVLLELANVIEADNASITALQKEKPELRYQFDVSTIREN